jgi:hypothetical protein
VEATLAVSSRQQVNKLLRSEPNANNEVLALILRYNDCKNEKLHPLLVKAGIQRNMHSFFIASDSEPRMPGTWTLTEQAELHRTINECRLALGSVVTALKLSGEIQLLDANKNGVINGDDILPLVVKFVEVGKKKMEPLLEKAGIEVSEKGHIITSDFKTRIRERLTPAEQGAWNEAVNEASYWDALIDAAWKEVFKKK